MLPKKNYVFLFQPDTLFPYFKKFCRLSLSRLKDSDAAVRFDATAALASCALHLALHPQLPPDDSLAHIAQLTSTLAYGISDASGTKHSMAAAQALTEVIYMVGGACSSDSSEQVRRPAVCMLPASLWLTVWPSLRAALDQAAHPAKPAVLACATSLASVLGTCCRYDISCHCTQLGTFACISGTEVRPILAELLASTLTELQNTDWMARKAAVETLVV